MGKDRLVIGLTGGVGSGKSYVLSLMERRYGALILEADRLCAALMEPGGSCYEPLLDLMGRDMTDEEGRIRRDVMAERIFGDEALRGAVNGLLHPATFEAARAAIEASKSPLVVYESALPKEARLKELCDRILYVHVDREKRICRLKRNRGYSREKAEAIMDSQLSEEAYHIFADASLDNGGRRRDTERALDRIMKNWGLKRIL